MDIPTILQETTGQELEALYNAIVAAEENKDGNYIITKKQIAAHHATPEHVLSNIHKTCTQPQIKLALLNNPSLPRSILLSLCADKHPEVKKLAGLRLKNKWTPGQDVATGVNTSSNIPGGVNISSPVRKPDSGHKKQMFRRKAS